MLAKTELLAAHIIDENGMMESAITCEAPYEVFEYFSDYNINMADVTLDGVIYEYRKPYPY